MAWRAEGEGPGRKRAPLRPFSLAGAAYSGAGAALVGLWPLTLLAFGLSLAVLLVMHLLTPTLRGGGPLPAAGAGFVEGLIVEALSAVIVRRQLSAGHAWRLDRGLVAYAVIWTLPATLQVSAPAAIGWWLAPQHGLDPALVPAGLGILEWLTLLAVIWLAGYLVVWSVAVLTEARPLSAFRAGVGAMHGAVWRYFLAFLLAVGPLEYVSLMFASWFGRTEEPVALALGAAAYTLVLFISSTLHAEAYRRRTAARPQTLGEVFG